MNRTPRRFETLVQEAGREPLPPIDVADRVLQSIGPQAQPRTADWSMWPAVGLSLAAALAVLLLVVEQGVVFEDPLAPWLRSLVLVMQ